jgi:hypothetical protein
MDRLALVELELAGAVVLLDHAGVLVLRLPLVDHPPVVGLGLQLPDRDHHQRGDCRRGGHPTAGRPESRDGDERDQQREHEERVARAHQRDQDEGGEERANEAAGRRERIEPPGHLTRLLDIGYREAERPR